MALRDQPYLPLYVQDFLTDEKLMECSASATGIYIRLICIMHKSDEYGVILLKQKDKQTNNQIKNFALKLAKYLPYNTDEIIVGLSELISEGVLQNGGDKLSQKRMIKDNEISIIRSKAGKKGGLKTQFAKAKPKANTEDDNDNKDEDIIDLINVSFEDFWFFYDKKRGDKTKLEKKWNSLNDMERVAIMEYIPLYIESQPDKTFRKDPQTFLNNKSWNDELIIKTNGNNKGSRGKGATPQELAELFAKKYGTDSKSV